MVKSKAERKEQVLAIVISHSHGLHGIAAAFLYDALRTDTSIERTWLVSQMVVCSLANVLVHSLDLTVHAT